MIQDQKKLSEISLEAKRLGKRYCENCLQILSDEDFYKNKKISILCKKCFNAHRRKKYNESEAFRQKEKLRFKAYYKFKKLKNAAKQKATLQS